MTVGERIKARRISLGLSQEELGKRIGVTKSTVSLVERGEGMTTDRLARYAKALECSVHDLLGFNEPVPDYIVQNGDMSHLVEVASGLKQSSFETLLKYAEFLREEDG